MLRGGLGWPLPIARMWDGIFFELEKKKNFTSRSSERARGQLFLGQSEKKTNRVYDWCGGRSIYLIYEGGDELLTRKT